MGRGWRQGKRVGCEGTQLLYRAGAPDRKSSGLPRLPLIARPYARALEAAGIIAEQLNVPITVDPLITERFSFTCDIGSSLAELRAGWPDLAFDHLPDP
jgi:broad specificity phosphatase PhoE